MNETSSICPAMTATPCEPRPTTNHPEYAHLTRCAYCGNDTTNRSPR